jgi:hypothetical protein
MNDNTAAAAQVVAVLLADGWHHIIRGSFSVGPLALGADTGLGGLGFRFQEADTGSLHKPTSLAGPLDSIIAVRQVAPAVPHLNDLDRARAAHNGRRADHGARLPVRGPLSGERQRQSL